MRTVIAIAAAIPLLAVSPAAASIGPEHFPARAEVAQILDLDRPAKIEVARSAVDEYFGVVPRRCDITYHLGKATENRQVEYWYATSTYIVSPSIEIRRYDSKAQAADRFRDVKRRLNACVGRSYEDPPDAPTGGKVRLDGYRPPHVGQASFGLTARYCCEGGPAKSRIIVSRAGDTIVWMQGMNYGAAPVRMPTRSRIERLARLAVAKAR